SITEVTIGEWVKNDGDLVIQDEVLAEIESDKATFELTAEVQGVLTIVAKQGETLPVGALICKIEVAEDEEKNQTYKGSETQDQAVSEKGKVASSSVAGHPSPAAAKILAEKGIEVSKVK